MYRVILILVLILSLSLNLYTQNLDVLKKNYREAYRRYIRAREAGKNVKAAEETYLKAFNIYKTAQASLLKYGNQVLKDAKKQKSVLSLRYLKFSSVSELLTKATNLIYEDKVNQAKALLEYCKNKASSFEEKVKVNYLLAFCYTVSGDDEQASEALKNTLLLPENPDLSLINLFPRTHPLYSKIDEMLKTQKEILKDIAEFDKKYSPESPFYFLSTYSPFYLGAQKKLFEKFSNFASAQQALLKSLKKDMLDKAVKLQKTGGKVAYLNYKHAVNAYMVVTGISARLTFNLANKTYKRYRKVKLINPVEGIYLRYQYENLKKWHAYFHEEYRYYSERKKYLDNYSSKNWKSINEFLNKTITVEDVFNSIPVNITESMLKRGFTKAKVQLITDNMQAWYARWYMLSQAKRTIDITYFILDDDPFGRAFLGMLLKKAREGVRIRIMLDARGVKMFTRSLVGQDYIQDLMEEGNVECRTFRPLLKNLVEFFGSTRSIFASNHDKLIIVDSEWVITGGRNVAAHYYLDPRDNEHVYRDTDVLIKCPDVGQAATLAFEEEFLRRDNFVIKKNMFGNWFDRVPELEFYYETMDSYIRGKGVVEPDRSKFSPFLRHKIDKMNKELLTYKLLTKYEEFTPFPDNLECYVKILDKHSFTGTRNDITPNLIRLIDASTHEIIIQNPYVVFTNLARQALQRANDRGVKIILHTNSPMSTDSLATQAMFLLDWQNILKAMLNLEIWASKGPNKLHSKVFLFDRKISVIGTYNMDPMSQDINSEVVAVIKSDKFATKLRQVIMNDLKNAYQYKIKVNSDSTVKVLFGPSSHSKEAVLKRLKLLGIARYFRPLI